MLSPPVPVLTLFPGFAGSQISSSAQPCWRNSRQLWLPAGFSHLLMRREAELVTTPSLSQNCCKNRCLFISYSFWADILSSSLAIPYFHWSLSKSWHFLIYKADMYHISEYTNCVGLSVNQCVYCNNCVKIDFSGLSPVSYTFPKKLVIDPWRSILCESHTKSSSHGLLNGIMLATALSF